MATAKLRVKAPKQGQYVNCRGFIWEFLGTDPFNQGFWNLRLIKEGTKLSETPIEAWILPEVEGSNISLVEDPSIFTPYPSKEQKISGKNFKPYLHARAKNALQSSVDSSSPNTALQCAIQKKNWQYEPWNRIAKILPFPRLLIADDVGLGKTTEAGIVLVELVKRRRANRILIIAPQHLAEKWQTEMYERFSLDFEIYDRETRIRLEDRGVKNPWSLVEKVIVSQDFAKRWENHKALKNVNWDMVVVDEAHHFVREKGEAATRLRDLIEDVAYRSPGLMLLTATPFTGKTDAFHSLLRLLDPKFHDPKFVEKWDPNNPYLVRRLKKDAKEYGEIIYDRKISHVYLTDPNSKIKIDTDKTSEKSTVVEVSLAESALLKEAKKCLDEIKSKGGHDLLHSSASKRLSSSWQAFYKSITEAKHTKELFDEGFKARVDKFIKEESSGKMKALVACIQKIYKDDPQAKVLVFTEFADTMLAVASYLRNNSTLKFTAEAVATIQGDTPHRERLNIEDDFSNIKSNLKVLVATDTLSEGKDLQHACNHLIHFELPWSMVCIEQRNGRIDRLGQKKVPYIHNLIFINDATPDQALMGRLTQKLESAREEIGSVAPIIENFSDFTDNEEDMESAMEKLDDSIRTAKSFSLTSKLSTISMSNQLEEPDATTRVKNFEIMIKTLGGSVTPAESKSKDKDVKRFAFSLPTDPRWSLPFLHSMNEDYPTQENPWFITLDAQEYLNYEDHRRIYGEKDRILKFLSPVHPIVLQAEARFKAHCQKNGYPIFSVANLTQDSVVLAEITLRSTESNIVSQRLVAIELNNFLEIPLEKLESSLEAVENMSDQLPSKKTWERLEDELSKLTKKFAQELNRVYQDRILTIASEVADLPQSVKGFNERKKWVDSLWNLDPSKSQFQIQALLVRAK